MNNLSKNKNKKSLNRNRNGRENINNIRKKEPHTMPNCNLA